MSFFLDVDRAASVFALLFAFAKDDLDDEGPEEQFRGALFQVTLGVKVPDGSIDKLRGIFMRATGYDEYEEPPSIVDLAQQVVRDFGPSRELLVYVVEILLRLSSDDGMIGRHDKTRLRDVLTVFNLSIEEFDRLPEKSQAILTECYSMGSVDISRELAGHYKILGCSPDASDAELRRRYRSLAMQFHPDRSVVRGEDRDPRAQFERVQRAYEAIRESRQ